MNFNFLLTDSIEASFNAFTTTTIVITILSSLIGILVFALIVTAIIKAVKNNKNSMSSNENEKSLFDHIKESIEEKNNPFVNCEYCGSQNKKTETQCSKCGANLNRKK